MEIYPRLFIIPMQIAKSSDEPNFGISTGEILTVIFLGIYLNPEFL